MQVRRLSEIWHRNVVTLIGYCQEGGLQMLVFEYLPNGSVCRHLYGNDFSRATVALLINCAFFCLPPAECGDESCVYLLSIRHRQRSADKAGVQAEALNRHRSSQR
jgi:hypothetical protein